MDRAPTPTVTLADIPHLEVWRAFLEAHAVLVRRLGDELRAEEDLPLAWYDVLVHLVEADGNELRMQELADAVLLSKSGLTRLVDRMESVGLVERRACPTDRRGTLAALTTAGRARLRAASPTHLRGVRQHFTDLLTDEEAAVLARVLDRIQTASGRA